MKTLHINLRDEYEIPIIIKELTHIEWETLINYVAKILSFPCREKNNNTSDDDIINGLKDTINKLEINENTRIKELTNEFNTKTAVQTTYFNELKIRYDKMINELNEELYTIKNSNNHKIYELTEQFKTEYDRKYTDSQIKYNKIIDELNDEILTIKKTTSNKIHNEAEQIKNSYEQKYTDLQMKYKTDYESKISILNEQLKNKELSIQILNQSINNTNTTHEMFEQIKGSIAPLTVFYGNENSSTAKGADGEKKVFDLLQCGYDDAIIQDVSGTPHSGDIWFMKGNMKLLIEIKNKKVLILDDMNKFIGDIKHNSGNINCGLFISLHTNKFPNKTKELLQIEYIDTVPVIYIHLTNVSVLYSAISVAFHMTTNKVDYGMNYMTDYQTFLINTITHYTKLITTKEKEITQLEKLREECNMKMTNINKKTELSSIEKKITTMELMRGYVEICKETDVVDIASMEVYFKQRISPATYGFRSFEDMRFALRTSYIEDTLNIDIEKLKELFDSGIDTVKKKDLIYNTLITENNMKKITKVCREDLMKILYNLTL